MSVKSKLLLPNKIKYLFESLPLFSQALFHISLFFAGTQFVCMHVFNLKWTVLCRIIEFVCCGGQEVIYSIMVLQPA